MAKIIYEVKRNANTASTAYGRWFAQVKNLETLNTRKLANHISEHGSIYTPDVVYGVLEKFRACLLEMLLESKKVKIDGLGTFYCTLENQKRGAAKKDEFSVLKHLKALHIRFLPEQAQEENISSREFLKKAEFINIEQLMKGTKSSDDNENVNENAGGGSGSNTNPTNGTNGGSDSGNSGSQTGGSGSDSGSGSGSGSSTTGGSGSGNSGSGSSMGGGE